MKKSITLIPPSKGHGWISSDHPSLKERLICFEVELLKSEAYRALKTPACYVVYAIFKTKCQMEPETRHTTPKDKRCKDSPYTKWIITNNGRIKFTEDEAEGEYGMSRQVFRRAIFDLIDKGFIDIAKRGGSSTQRKNLYSISDRWKLYGTKQFVKRTHEKATNHKGGFKKGNKYGVNCDPEAREKYRKEEQNKKKERNRKRLDKVESELKRLKLQRDKFIRGEEKLSKMLDKANCKDKAKKKKELQRIRKQLIYNEEAIKSKAEHLKNLRQWLLKHNSI